jgi:hypothetical protein
MAETKIWKQHHINNTLDAERKDVYQYITPIFSYEYDRYLSCGGRIEVVPVLCPKSPYSSMQRCRMRQRFVCASMNKGHRKIIEIKQAKQTQSS